MACVQRRQNARQNAQSALIGIIAMIASISCCSARVGGRGRGGHSWKRRENGQNDVKVSCRTLVGVMVGVMEGRLLVQRGIATALAGIGRHARVVGHVGRHPGVGLQGRH